MTGMMTEGGRGRVRGRDSGEGVTRVLGEGALMDPNRRAWGCLYVYVTSQPQPVCIDRVQTECLYQSFMRQPLGTRCLPAQRDSPLSGPLSSTEKAQEESNSHTSRASPHWARIWTDTGGSALSKKGETITNMPPRRLTSWSHHGGEGDYLRSGHRLYSAALHRGGLSFTCCLLVHIRC